LRPGSGDAGPSFPPAGSCVPEFQESLAALADGQTIELRADPAAVQAALQKLAAK